MRKILLVIIFASFFAVSCASAPYVRTKAIGKIQKGARVGILSFSNLTPYPNAGVVLSEALTSLLYSRGINVLGPAETEKVFPEYRMVSLNDFYKLDMVGKKLKLDFIIFGYVEEYGYRGVVFGTRSAPVISFSLYVYDIKKREIIYTGFFNYESQSLSSFGVDPLITLLKEITKWVTKDFWKKLL